MKKNVYIIIIIILILLVILLLKNNQVNTITKLYGKYELDNTNYFEFFKDNYFEYTCINCPVGLLYTNNKQCLISGNYNIDNDYLNLDIENSNCTIISNKYKIKIDKDKLCFYEYDCDTYWKLTNNEPERIIIKEEIKEKEKLENIIVFYSNTCEHCHNLLEYLNQLGLNKYITKYEINEENNYNLEQDYASKFGDKDINGVPYIIINNKKSFYGFTNKFKEYLNELDF